MSRLTTTLSSPKVQFWTLVTAAVLGALVVLFAGYQARYILSNIDGISYISIARQYVAGEFETALNAYWSPMISWLLLPFMLVGIDGQLAFMIVNALSTIVGVLLGAHLVWRYTHKAFWPTAIFLFLGYLFYTGNLYSLTPDTLVTTWVIVFVYTLAEITRRLNPGTRRQRIIAGVVLGIVCLFGYLTKLFLVPVFVVTIAAVLLIRVGEAHARDKGVTVWQAAKPALVTVAAAVVTLVILVAPWSAVLSAKYGMFTVGSSFAVNVEAKFEPGAGEVVPESTVLLTPPNENAISFGEDRTNQVEGAGFESTSSVPQRLKYYLTSRIDAFPSYVNKIGTMAPYAIVIVFIFSMAVIGGAVAYRRNRVAVFAAVTWAVYFIGYAGIASLKSGGGNSRYYWPLYILSVLIACLMLPQVWEKLSVPPRVFWKRLTLVILVSLLLVSTVWQHGLGRSAPFSGPPAPAGIGYILNGGTKPVEQVLVEDKLSKIIPAGSQIVGSNYRQSLKYAYYLDRVQIFGRSDQGYDITNPVFQQELRDKGIDFYLLFTPEPREPLDLTSLGTVVDSFTMQSTCDDIKVSKTVDCQIDVIKVTP
jgi:hypothetical protein